jgi:hypothetical protein
LWGGNLGGSSQPYGAAFGFGSRQLRSQITYFRHGRVPAKNISLKFPTAHGLRVLFFWIRLQFPSCGGQPHWE